MRLSDEPLVEMVPAPITDPVIVIANIANIAIELLREAKRQTDLLDSIDSRLVSIDYRLETMIVQRQRGG
jgi:hypothetical protein